MTYKPFKALTGVRIAVMSGAVAFGISTFSTLQAYKATGLLPLLQLLALTELAVLVSLAHGCLTGSRRALWAMATVQLLSTGMVLTTESETLAQAGLCLLHLFSLGLLLTRGTRRWAGEVERQWKSAGVDERNSRSQLRRAQAISWCLAPLALASVAYSLGLKPWVGGAVGLPLSCAGLVLMGLNRRNEK